MNIALKLPIRRFCWGMALAAVFALTLVGQTSPTTTPQGGGATPPTTDAASADPAGAQHDTSAAESASIDANPNTSLFNHSRDSRFWISGQANFIYQTHPPFHAPYTGPNSLIPQYEKAISRVLTLYTGLRLNNSTAALLDIEEAGGSGLSQTLGLAGFPNLDVVRNPTLSKKPYLARVMLHKVFRLSKDNVETERGPLSMFTELPRRRLEVRAGKFGMVDFFDLNSVGSDSHLQFMNWTIDQNGAYDFPADTRGYTWGAVLDYEDRSWGLRFSEALEPTVANGIKLVGNLTRAHSESYEFELRRSLLPHRAARLRLLAFSNQANMGIYRVAIDRFLDGQGAVPDITAHPPQKTRKYGFGVNAEQGLNRWVTAFGRFGWNNGKTESWAYTEVDQTFAGGVGFLGERWHRKNDRAGIAFVSNAVSGDHRRYLALGGLGFLIGDGKLNYGREKILESYYTTHLWKGFFVSPGVQYVANPAYNRDRGPVVIPVFRVHLEI